MTQKVQLQPYQDRFVFSKAMYPALIAGWGTGKTLSLIARAMHYSRHIPDNLGIIFRKEYVDLADSTIKDFERYTDIKVDSHREAHVGSSSILFRHIEELNNIQNINLGWFAIEQAEELETDREFFTLFGRLRRKIVPSAEFKVDGLPERTGFIIGNTGRDWVTKLWKLNEANDTDFDLTEATTFDNKENLPADFMLGLEKIRREHEPIYKRFVLNAWDLNADDFVLISPASIEALKGSNPVAPHARRLVVCDPSQGGDECVIYVMQEGEIIDHKYVKTNDTMKIVGEMIESATKYRVNSYGGDCIGIGAGVFDRLSEIFKEDPKVMIYRLNSAARAINPDKYPNIRSEMWIQMSQDIIDRKVCYPVDQELRRQLASVKYAVLKSNGFMRIEEKVLTKKRLGNSPDRADAFVMGNYIMKQIPTQMPALEDDRLTPAYIQEKYMDGKIHNYAKHNDSFRRN